ncbi:MAG: GAF domain-containing protein [Scytonema sp. PMC 1069.18]|nr:GAF domain-containing protein [Scytonema sp. PMC 1069.18]MEC4881232.1 GAF domain-containing protein [Scytonema sp. PMC 1070.18]
MKQPLSSPPKRRDDVERQQRYPVKLMQHQEESALQLAREINTIIANSPTPTKMLQEIAQVLGVAFNVDYCSLVTVATEPSNEVVSANWYSKTEHLKLLHQDEMFSPVEQMDLPVMECASEPLTIEDISTIQQSLALGCQYLPQAKAVLAIPTKFGGKNNGVISLIKSQPYIWTDAEKELLQSVETSCALAFSHVVQVQQIAYQQKYLQTCDQHQSLIQQLTILSRSNWELNQMLQLALASTAEILQADRGLLILLKYKDPLFRSNSKKQIPKATVNVVCEWSREKEIPLTNKLETPNNFFYLSDCGLCQRAFIHSGQPIIINDNLDLKDTLTVSPVFGLEELPAVLLMPLAIQGKVLGFLVLQQAVARNWEASELNILELVCAQLSNAIIQNQTLRQVQMLVDERTAKLQSSLELQAKLHERTRQYVEQLRELNELKDEFLSNLSDRLRYPLTNMRMSLRMLRQPGITPERQVKYLDILEEECTKEINLINDLLTLQKLETHQERPQLENVDLNTKVQDIAVTFEQKLADKGLSISLNLPTEPLTIQTEIESFNRIFHELLTNAYKYSEHDTVVHLQVAHEVNQLVDRVIIKVTNVGRGISEEEAAYIFDKFRRGKGRWTPGTGLGLALVKSLVQHIGGEIGLESTPIEDSRLSYVCFTLTLPQFSDESNS